MKFLHISDLHLGKRVNEFSMTEDQRYILARILDVAREESPDGVLIAGDVYDKPVPSAEAVELFDGFLTDLARMTEVFVLSGNHDSPERIAFGGRIMGASGVHLSPVYSGTLAPVTLKGDIGEVAVYMLPFVRPAHVRRFHPDEDIKTYTDAVRVALAHADETSAERRVLVAHMFVTGASRTDSEDISVGGADNVDVSALAGFDYVALGHIHRPQNVAPGVRYSGSPLKYSFSEISDKKSVTVVELGGKGEVSVRTVPLTPLRDLKEIKGTYAELTARDSYEGTTYRDDYMHIILTDEDDVPEALGKLRVIYRNLMKLEYRNSRTSALGRVTAPEAVRERTPAQLLGELFVKQNDRPMPEEQAAYVRALAAEIWEEDE